jgi:hypothetical protein
MKPQINAGQRSDSGPCCERKFGAFDPGEILVEGQGLTMKSRFISDLQDPVDSHFNAGGSEVLTNFVPAPGIGFGSPFSSLSAFAPPTPNLPGCHQPKRRHGYGFHGRHHLQHRLYVRSHLRCRGDGCALKLPRRRRSGGLYSVVIHQRQDQGNINIDYSGAGGGAASGPDKLANNDSFLFCSDLSNSTTPSIASASQVVESHGTSSTDRNRVFVSSTGGTRGTGDAVPDGKRWAR